MREKRSGTQRPARGKTATPKKGGKPGSRSRTDWARVDATSDADIAEQVGRNADEIEFTDAMLSASRWVMPVKKVPISFRVDPDVLAFFRAGGDGYQSRMNAVLRGYMHGIGPHSGKRHTG